MLRQEIVLILGTRWMGGPVEWEDTRECDMCHDFNDPDTLRPWYNACIELNRNQRIKDMKKEMSA